MDRPGALLRRRARWRALRARARAALDAWITGIRREQSPTRADAQPVEWDEKRGLWKFNPLVDWTEKDVWTRIVERDLPVPPAARPGLRLDRLRALHAAGHRPRGPLGGQREDRVRPARHDRHPTPALSHLRALEAEAIHVMREVAAERERPALLFCGGKDSIVLLRLAQKAFAPGRFPFPLLHVDTGHNFPEVLEFRDRLRRRAGRAAARGLRAGVDRRRPRASRRPGRAPRATGCRRRRCWTRSRRTASTPASAARGATRSARAPRSACSRCATTSAGGTRAASGPSCGTSTTRASRRGEHLRVFPISNWTELDVWQYIAAEELELPSIYLAHEREVFARDGMLLRRLGLRRADRRRGRRSPTSVRYRTVGDMSCTGAVRLARGDAATTWWPRSPRRDITERGETRADDRASEAAMEDRKRAGYF